MTRQASDPTGNLKNRLAGSRWLRELALIIPLAAIYIVAAEVGLKLDLVR